MHFYDSLPMYVMTERSSTLIASSLTLENPPIIRRSQWAHLQQLAHTIDGPTATQDMQRTTRTPRDDVRRGYCLVRICTVRLVYAARIGNPNTQVSERERGRTAAPDYRLGDIRSSHTTISESASIGYRAPSTQDASRVQDP